ncbi:hypothetical protein ZEAMMB73_Zm00001d047219 [Zea mays]|uniref:Uncharacterized protein n=1 Tax=Zea mays TaxID=4577 RepID=K7VCX8_MAIZE|nr:hypothetical protein ZEAMMB73_Zm00001d047219 [Zea mays]
MEPSTFDDSMDYQILACLVTNKTLAKDRSSWDPTDDEVQRVVLSLLEGSKDIDANKLKQYIAEFEMIVKNNWECSERIVANKEMMLDVFDYVVADFVPNFYQEPTLRLPSISPRSNGCWTKEQLFKKLTGPISMNHCTEKLKKCGFSKQQLWDAIDILKADLELRRVFIRLEDSEARGYMIHALRNSNV